MIDSQGTMGLCIYKGSSKMLVQEYVTEHKGADSPIGKHLHKFCQFKDNKPGDDGLHTFMEKYELSSKKPSSLEKMCKIADSSPNLIYG